MSSSYRTSGTDNKDIIELQTYPSKHNTLHGDTRGKQPHLTVISTEDNDTGAGIGKFGLQPSYAKELGLDDIPHINPITEQIRRVDITIQITEIPRQDIMTKDNVNIAIESVLYWHIVDPYEAEFGVANVHFALVERARTSLRDVCGSHSLQDLIENRDAISSEIREIIDPISHRWGVKVEATLIKDITFSQQLQESLSSAATAKRLGESRVIASKAEVEAAKLMRDAADILATPAAMQLRQLETLTSMSRNAQGPKTIFIPLPSSGEQVTATIHAP
ncbi:hypothetical protein EC973_001459 [Apophysomyces ossiformis]|uniref:Band 7 domain-containing protein n=1 Tax=Apophysomyces ossiformis TaxID=679940 RepID=A0A8H7BHW1_9FUNG|nr:hypothetical protein EC973_001459 [Apophysomyces ossiformis]